jgi:hypothetical protein
MTNELHEKRTSRELAAMIAERLGLTATFVHVSADPAYGWFPIVMASPHHPYALQQKAEEIAQALRLRYELSE